MGSLLARIIWHFDFFFPGESVLLLFLFFSFLFISFCRVFFFGFVWFGVVIVDGGFSVTGALGISRQLALENMYVDHAVLAS